MITDVVFEISQEAPSFAHQFHTCYNKSLNSLRTHDTPKNALFWKNFHPRSCKITFFKWNYGPEYVQEIYQTLGLPTAHLRHYISIERQKKERNTKRKRDQLYSKEKHELKKLKLVRSSKQARISIKNNNLYKQEQKKSISQLRPGVSKKDSG